MTNVPAQALAMLNDPFVQQQAAFWARRLLAEDPNSAIAGRLTKMFEEALGRPPSRSELVRFRGLLESVSSIHGGSHQEADEAIWKDVAHVLFNLTEFIYIP
mgnify:CR=1 FL=1